MKYLKLFESFEDTDSICKKYGLQNYTINDDGTIDVDGGVNLNNKKLSKIPLKFRNVSGDFLCSSNQLTSLEGCPTSVGRDFYCDCNQLTSLQGCPTNVGGNFLCSDNQLTSLEGCPNIVDGNFYCTDNQLTSLEGCPTSVGGHFYCHNNPVHAIWNLFEDFSKIELFNDFDAIRGNNIVLDRLNDFLEIIGKNPVKQVKGYNIL